MRHAGDAGKHIGEPGQRIEAVEFFSHDQRHHKGGAVGASEELRLSSERKASQGSLGVVVVAVAKESGEAVPALEQVIDGLCDGSRARQSRALLAKPGFQIGQKRRALILAHAQAFAGAKPIDGALDLEQRVDAFYRFQRNRRDGRRLFAAPCAGGDVGQFEELTARMRPTQR